MSIILTTHAYLLSHLDLENNISANNVSSTSGMYGMGGSNGNTRSNLHVSSVSSSPPPTTTATGATAIMFYIACFL
jgi:hypothetical protein